EALAEADGAALGDDVGLPPPAVGDGAACGASAASPCAEGDGEEPTDEPGDAEPVGAGVDGALGEPLGTAEPFGRSWPVFNTARNSRSAGCSSYFSWPALFCPATFPTMSVPLWVNPCASLTPVALTRCAMMSRATFRSPESGFLPLKVCAFIVMLVPP